MTRYADPRTCPDCGSAIDPAFPQCATCSLPLHGPLAQQLFVTLQQADGILGRLRATAPAPAPLRPTRQPAAPPTPAPPQQPSPASGAPDAPRAGLAAPTVPKILLGLGALCLLVAALVFLAVAWAVLGVGGRTVVLLSLTAAAGAASYLLATRGLRSGAESLSVVGFGLLALVVVGADHAGWLGDRSPSVVMTVTGAALFVLAYAAAEVAATTAVRRLLAAEITAAVGSLLVVFGAAWRLDPNPEIAFALAVVGLSAAALFARRRQLTVLPVLLAVTVAWWWLLLLLTGLDRAMQHHTLGELWGQLQAWPVLAAGLLALTPALLPRLQQGFRVAGAATAATIAVVIATMPANYEGTQTGLIAWGIPLVVTAAAVFVVPGPWRLVPLAPMLVSAVLPLLVLVRSLATTLDAIAPTDVWHRAATAPIPVGAPPVSPYLLVPTLLALVLAGVAGTRLTGRPLAPFRRDAALLGSVLGAGLLVTLVFLDVPLLVVVLGLVVIAAGLAAEALRSGRDTWLAGTAVLLVLALVAGLASTWTTAIVLAAIAGAAATLTRTGSPITLPAGHAVLPPALAGLVWTAAEIGQLEPGHRGFPVLLLLGALAIARPHPVGDVAAGLAATVASAAAIGAATDSQASLALHLTLAGALVTISSLVNPERRRAGWLGGLLLAMATWVRLEQLGVTAPEPYTLPSATALLVVGGLHLRRHRDASTYTALLPGLGLALVPSLLWALADPISWRALALGLACTALVVAGAAVRWSAPIVAGAGVVVVLVLREASPFLGSIHPWIVIGLVGALLTALGVTWESRVKEVRAAGAYLRRLR